MATNAFNAEEVVEQLTYDFTKYVADAEGEIPEPSDTKINAFKKALGALIKETTASVPLEEEDKPVTVLKQIGMLSEFLSRDDSALSDKIVHACADLCSDSPSYDQIKPLPYRVKQAFFGWLVEVFIRPEASAPVMTMSAAGSGTGQNSTSQGATSN